MQLLKFDFQDKEWFSNGGSVFSYGSCDLDLDDEDGIT
jgi:hypothetical protein